MFTHNIYNNLRVRVIIIHDGKLLMNAPNRWGLTPEPYRYLPGGGLEPNESLCEVGEREVFEETGLRVKAKSVAFLREWVVPKSVPLDVMKAEEESHGFWKADEYCPDHAYTLEVFVWGELPNGQSTELKPKDGADPRGDWVPLEQIEHEPLFPPELRALARDLLAGRPPVGVPSFVTGLGTPYDKPDYEAFRRMQ